MPISWKCTLQQYVGRLHRLHDHKRFVRVYDYVDQDVRAQIEGLCRDRLCDRVEATAPLFVRPEGALRILLLAGDLRVQHGKPHAFGNLTQNLVRADEILYQTRFWRSSATAS